MISIGKRQVFRAARINHLGQYQVRTHALDFGNNVAFAGKSNCDHQDDACAADNDAQHGEHGAHFVRAQGLQRKLYRFIPEGRRVTHNIR